MTAYLADTNVILRWVLPHDPLSAVIRAAVKRLIQQGHTVYVGAQNLDGVLDVDLEQPKPAKH